jgi:hypothetical protein
MANPNGNPQNLILFRPGKSGNPGGKPAAARNRIQGRFLNALADDFAQHGVAAIAACRERTPSRYLAIVASLVPRQFDTSCNPLNEWSDEELDRALAALRLQISAPRGEVNDDD